MDLKSLQALYSQNNLGQFKVFQDPKYGNYLYIPPVGGFSGGYFSVDQQSINQLDQSKLTQGGPMQWFDSSGISHVAFSDPVVGQIQGGALSGAGQQSFDNISNQLQSQIQQNQEQQRVSQLNSAIASGDTATVEKLSPGYTLWNGAFVNKSSIPNLQKEGATVQGGNVVGGALPKQTPTTQTLTDISPTGTQTSGVPAYKVAVPITPQNPGGFDVYDTQGNKLTYESLAKGPDGKPLVNLDNLPVQGGTTGATPFNPTKYGISQDQWNQLDPSAQAFVESATQLLQSQYDQGQTNVSINAKLLNDAIAAAAKDPNIIAKYGDAARFGLSNLNQSLAMINAEYAQTQGLLGTQQLQERKALAEQTAQAGQAFSGFREQAKQRLAQSQSGVIESSKRQLQQNLSQLGTSFESQFGTSALPSISAGGLAYQPLGGVTGSDVLGKQADILSKGQNIYSMEKLT